MPFLPSRLITTLFAAACLASLTGCSHFGASKSGSADAGEALHLAHVLRDNGRMAAAYEVYAQADKRQQLKPAELLEFAQVASNVMPAQDALPLFVRAREQLRSPTDEQRFGLCLGIGRGQLALGQLPKAQESFQCALDSKPGSSDALNGLAIVQSSQGHGEDAERLFQQVLDHDPSNAAALNNLALNRLNEGKPQAAVDLLANSELRGQPTLVLNLALAYLLLHEDDKARDTLQQNLPRIRTEPLLANLQQSAQRIQNGQSASRELLAASRRPLALETLQ